jgi:urea carboxylase system permease
MSRTDDERDLAMLGYRQRLDRSLGAWSSFAVSYGWVAILCGLTAMFFFGFAAAGPAFFWAYPLVGVIQLFTALCLAEIAGQVPAAGSMYQWSRHLTRSRFIPWIAGWFLMAGMLVTVSLVGPQVQQLLTTVSADFLIVGGAADIGTATTRDGAINAILLGGIAIVVMTIVNVVGVRWTARVTNAIVSIELAAVVLTCVALAVHVTRGPGIVFQTHGTGATHSWGWPGALLLATIVGAYVFFGFENAASLSEETRDPRRRAPRAILQALILSVVVAMILALLGLMAVKDINAPQLGTAGFPYLMHATLGRTLGDVLLLTVALAVVGSATAVQATTVRTIFAIARDDGLPFSRRLAHVPGRWNTPVLATLITAVAALALLFVNYGNPAIFSTLGSVAILLFYICYLLVLGPMLVARLRGRWPRADHGSYFSLGRWGLPINLAAVVSSLAVGVNVAWPRTAVYGDAHWYTRYGAFSVVGLLLITGVPYYLLVQRRRTHATVGEHRAVPEPAVEASVAPRLAYAKD